MRRRSKPRVVWLPTTNTFSVDAGATSGWNLASVPFSIGASGDAGVIEVPIVMDGNTSDPLDPTSSLADIESSGYRLRRIVGKLYCFVAQGITVSQEIICGISAGFIIRRVDGSTGGSLAVAASAATNFDLIDPAKIDNTMDPWIWRRDWLLSCGPSFVGEEADPPTIGTDSLIAGRGGGANFGKFYPGGNAEGPHVDQKTARIVGPEERLFLDVSATTIIGLNASANSSLVIIYNFRVLASMRSNIGNRRNASR